MNETFWHGLQAHHLAAYYQAEQILARPLAAWEEGTMQELWRSWAEQVLAAR